MYKKRLRILISIGSIVSVCHGQDIASFDDYQKTLNHINKHYEERFTNKLISHFKKLKNQSCTIEIKEHTNTAIINPICLRHEITLLSPQDTIQYLSGQRSGIQSIYNTESREFSYEGTQLQVQSNSDIYLQHKQSLANMATVLRYEYQKKDIEISLYQLADISQYHYDIYASKASLVERDNCTKQNLLVSLQSLHNYLLPAGQSLNFNKHISNIEGYCKGTGPQNLKFYGGACGSASQLFRISLLIPEVNITQRRPHSYRYTKYYGDELMGDDAAIYEMSKQLEIQNTSDQDIYFTTQQTDTEIYLIALGPKNNQTVHITKEYNQPRQTNIKRLVQDTHNKQTIQDNDFASSYLGIQYSLY